MKIRYLEPKPRGATIYEIANLPKLGLPLLAAIARNAYPDVDQHIYCELIRNVEVDWDDVLTADLVCISTTTNTTLEGYRYADRCRAAYRHRSFPAYRDNSMGFRIVRSMSP